MKVRHKEKKYESFSNQFNINSVAPQEMLLEGDSDYIKDYEAFIEALGEWKDMNQAFKDKDIITDNYNTIFFEPTNEEDRKRGYTL